MVSESPTDMPVVLQDVNGGIARAGGTARPELERPRR